ncbi:hypothetical protein [Marinimicrococcus flavescens]|uniref:SMP-30/Gluconolactonase/LRE-like region domain-containing protein n=1 Tax=Marinimicrococcus flavescens TaxID=3031815 RepID=A0AAP3XRR1_9PROT|nr:hypothetical protein [Marinimicrococcus flavescens]
MRTRGAVAIATLFLAMAPMADAAGIEGRVTLGGRPVDGAAVTLWATAGTASPSSLAEVATDAKGGFAIETVPALADGSVLYLTTKGGADDAVALMSVLGTEPPSNVVVNELTTVASVVTHARFIDGTAISGNELGLRIAAGNVPNLVDPATGEWGKVVLDPINSTENTTLARLNTLASMVAAFATVADNAWRTEFLEAATPAGGAASKDTLAAMAGIARTPWANPKALYALFDKAWPQPKNGARRSAPFVPYLAYEPPDFALMLKFAGGGIYSAGRLGIDAEGNIWSGQNWMAGSQSGVIRNIGGGTIKLAPDGTALSPPITGFTGMGVDGVGWGTGVTLEKVWVSSFNGAIGVMDLDGRPIGKAQDFPMAGKVGNLMGVGVAGNGDVWIADGTKDQLLHFPGGRVEDGRIVKVEGLKSPFGIAIDEQNRVWVSNSQSDTVVRFPADDPGKADSFRAGIGVRGVALDSKGNLWVASNMSLDFPPPKIPAGVSIMKQFQIVLDYMMPRLTPENPTGVVNMIRPDGTQPAPMGFTGEKAVSVPWGVSIDGNDDVWVGNFWGRGVVLMAGAEPKGHPKATKTGDAIHLFRNGSIQMVTDVAIDPAGNVWVANNWNDIAAAGDADPARPSSTWGGGSGIVAIYGVAAPVKPPLMGMVRGFSE